MLLYQKSIMLIKCGLINNLDDNNIESDTNNGNNNRTLFNAVRYGNNNTNFNNVNDLNNLSGLNNDQK